MPSKVPILTRLMTRATFYDGFITGATIGATILMIVFAYYLGALDYRETTIAVIIGIAFNIFIIVGATISRIRRLLAEE